MIPAEAREIIEALLAKASAGEVQWVVGETTDSDFNVNFPDQSINLARRGSGSFEFSIFDGRRNRIVNFTSHDREPEFAVMNELYGLARRKALNVQGVLEALKQQMRKPGVIGSGKPAGEKP